LAISTLIIFGMLHRYIFERAAKVCASSNPITTLDPEGQNNVCVRRHQLLVLIYHEMNIRFSPKSLNQEILTLSDGNARGTLRSACNYSECHGNTKLHEN
jgi:hypothetical protein